MIEDEDLDQIITYYMLYYNEQKNAQELMDIANGIGDGRWFAVKNWNWKRVQGNSVETWNLTPNDAKVIASGIGEIAPYDQEIDDEEFDIYIVSKKTSVYLTYKDLEAGRTTHVETNKIDLHNQAYSNFAKQNSNSFYKHEGD